MHYILNIETATTVCSVSISQDGHILGYKEIDNGFTHSENLHLFINDLYYKKLFI
jgi:tRNA threonylcarbamoyladenosine biosynthesis protein TsaB